MRTFADIYRVASGLTNDPELLSECVDQRIVYRVTQEEWDALRTYFDRFRFSTGDECKPTVALYVGALRVERRA